MATGTTLRVERENALLTAACRLDDGDVPSGSLDWAYIERAADVQGVASLLHEWLSRHPEVHVAPKAAQHLHDAYWVTHFRNRVLLAELDRLATAAALEGIAVMPLKGARLAVEYYGRAARRPLSDLDLFVPPQDIEAVSRLLLASGYDAVDPLPSYAPADVLDRRSRELGFAAERMGFSVLVECRTQPLELAVGRLTDFDSRYTDRLEEYAAHLVIRARGRTGTSSAGLKMPAEDLLLHVATHMAAKHVQFRLIWLHDIVRVLVDAPDFDWPYLLDVSSRLRTALPVAAALEAARRWLGAPVPDRWIAALQAAASVDGPGLFGRWESHQLRTLVGSLGIRDLTGSGPGFWPVGAALNRVNGWGPRLRMLRWVAWPCPAYVSHRASARASAVAATRSAVSSTPPHSTA